MSTTAHTQLNTHPVHTDPIEAALAQLVESGLAAELVCDGSCDGISSCAVAPVGMLARAA
ncbi:MAG TPA: hypothetical protein VIW46_04850 [Acidimicrobiia bacterium]|jgi:hypothetical protein